MANQLKKKFIGSDQVDSTKILLENATSLRSKKADGTEIDLVKIDGTNKVIIHKEGGAEEVGYKSQVDTVATDLAAEIVRATAAESQINSDITSALSTANSYADAAVLVEKNRAEAAEATLSSSISTVSSGLASEITRATAAEAQALVDAKAYTDAKKVLIDADIASVNTRVDNVLSNVDGVALNSLSEIVTAFQQADNDLNGAITSLAASASSGLAQEVLDRQAGDSALQAELDATQVDLASEITRATTAEAALDGRIDILEAYKIAQEALVKTTEKFTLTQTDIDNGYVNLAHLISSMSPTEVFVDRTPLHPGLSEDYVLPTVSGVTRILFKNDLIGSGNQKLQVGDNIYVRYFYSTI